MPQLTEFAGAMLYLSPAKFIRFNDRLSRISRRQDQYHTIANVLRVLGPSLRS